jgi:hypothetical protein
VRELREVERPVRREPLRLAGEEPVLALTPEDRELFIAPTGDAAAVRTLG